VFLKTEKNPPNYLLNLYQLFFILLPWSYEYSFGDFALVLPTEPLLILISFFLIKEISRPQVFSLIKDISFKKNPIIFASLLWIFWQIISVFTSTMPLVSAKYALVAGLHFMVFGVGVFIFPALFLRSRFGFLISLSLLIGYFFYQFSGYHFLSVQSNLAARPFFSDHTLFSAVLVMVICWLPFEKLSIIQLKNGSNSIKKMLLGTFSVLFLLGIYFSYCRAAWLTLLLVAFCFFVYLSSKLTMRNKGLLILALFGVLLFFSKNILSKSNHSDGNAKSGLEQLASIGNFKTDASNLERLNRYSCAWRMGLDKPFVGFGLGTYQFQYIPYQKPEEMTRISVTVPVNHNNDTHNGRGGGAHSEYFQALSELGFIGLFFGLLLISTIFYSFIRAYRHVDEAQKLEILCTGASLCSFLLHGLMNNFLHDSRIALLFWGQIAVLAFWERKINIIKF
jgi:putative inorganic carbon (hco3(-)) transporter